MAKRSFLKLAAPTFNILSVGERGTGKTVFLVGSYAEFFQLQEQTGRSPARSEAQPLWFECPYKKEKFLLNNILLYVKSQGSYPPPTLKITDFTFSFKQRQSQQERPFCYLHWWDMPGENCNFNNPYFQNIALSSQGCCVFINSYRLLNDPEYGAIFAYLQSQLKILLTFIRSYNQDYPFALVFTQGDRLPPRSEMILQQAAQPLLTLLTEASVNFRCFYTAITITPNDQQFAFNTNGVTQVFRWLLTTLYDHYHNGSLAYLKNSASLRCLQCGSENLSPSQSVDFLTRLGLLLLLKQKYRCRDCRALKTEFLPGVWWKLLWQAFR